MVADTQLISNLLVPPGEYLQEVIDELGVTQADLARRMGRPAQAINEIIRGEKAIIPETALQLEQVVGVPAHIWMGLETKFQLVKARQQAHAQEEKEAHNLKQWLQGLSYPALAKFAGLAEATKPVDRVREIRRFLGLSSLYNLEGVGALRPAFRQSQKVAVSLLGLAVWLRRAEREAEAIDTGDFDRSKLLKCLPGIRAMTTQSPEIFVPALHDRLAACGVAFTIQKNLPKTGVHGATFWLTPKKAAMVMTIRGAWADIFWFSLFHELGHLVLHTKKRTFLENESADPDVLELEADAFAADRLISANDFEAFLRETGGRFSKAAVRTFASQIGTHPGLVVGRLHHQKLVRPKMLNGLRTQFVWAEDSA